MFCSNWFTKVSKLGLWTQYSCKHVGNLYTLPAFQLMEHACIRCALLLFSVLTCLRCLKCSSDQPSVQIGLIVQSSRKVLLFDVFNARSVWCSFTECMSHFLRYRYVFSKWFVMISLCVCVCLTGCQWLGSHRATSAKCKVTVAPRVPVAPSLPVFFSSHFREVG